MNIAYFVNQYPKVSHIFIRREIEALENQGVKVHRFALRGWDADLVADEDFRERDLTQHVLRDGLAGLVVPILSCLKTNPVLFFQALILAFRMSRKSEKSLIMHMVYLAEASKLKIWLIEKKCSHVHAHFGTNSADVVMLANALGGPPYSFTVHGPDELDKPLFLNIGEKIKRAAFVAAITSYTRSQLFRWVEYRYWEKIKIVHAGLEPDYHQVPQLPRPKKTQFVCIGRLCEQKGQFLLIDAAKKLKENNKEVTFIMVGDGELRSEIEGLIEKNQLQDSVRITGWMTSAEVKQQILESSAVILPSFMEGLPSVIMEAMALRRPVLSTYVAGIPELVKHKENGWLFTPGSVEDLISAIEDFMAQSEVEIEKICDAAFERVLQRHNIANEVKKLAAFMEDSQ